MVAMKKNWSPKKRNIHVAKKPPDGQLPPYLVSLSAFSRTEGMEIPSCKVSGKVVVSEKVQKDLFGKATLVRNSLILLSGFVSSHSGSINGLF